jgi:hypothetical protein
MNDSSKHSQSLACSEFPREWKFSFFIIPKIQNFPIVNLLMQIYHLIPWEFINVNLSLNSKYLKFGIPATGRNLKQLQSPLILKSLR